MTPRPLSVSFDDLAPLFLYIQSHFYRNLPKTRYYQDRRMLLHALSWPASWLHQRRLLMRPAHYRQVLADRLHAIGAHGNPERYQPCFPRYLLKSLQDWIDHHGDKLYAELKTPSYALDCILDAIAQRPAKSPTAARDDAIEVLAGAHRLLDHALRRKTKSSPTPSQLNLF